MPCFVANSAVVSSPRSASRATFALKSAEYRFRLPTIGSVLIKGRTKLNHLSEIQGPPHSPMVASFQRKLVRALRERAGPDRVLHLSVGITNGGRKAIE